MIDWQNQDWAYLLGVIHGDGCLEPRSVGISVGYKDAEYADILVAMWEKLRFSPKTYRPRSCLRIQVHSVDLVNELRPFKANGLWCLPTDLNVSQWLAGVFDTDGCVTMASQKCAVIIILKRSGNLTFVRDALASLGIGDVAVHDRTSRFNGKPYAIEELRLTSFAKIIAFADKVTLRNPKKAERLRVTIQYITERLSVVPIWKKVALWLQEEPRTWEEIADRFDLTKPQVDSVIQNIRTHAQIEVIPPPKALNRYGVKNLSL